MLFRAVLCLLVLTAYACARELPLDPEGEENRSIQADVIIIGAGAAGICAASRLVENGYDVIVIEAESRIGGRIWSHRYGNGSIELGAQAVWGADNFLINYARENGLLAVPVNREQVPLVDTGMRVNSTLEGRINAITADLNRYLRALLDASAVAPHEQTLSLGEYLDLKFGEYVRASADPELTTTAYDAFVRVLKTEDSADSLYDLSLQTYIRRKDKNTRATLNIPFVDVLQRIGSNIPRKNILLGERVVKISRRFFVASGGRVSVRTDSGRTFTARHVIVTTSLGVLKADMHTLFEPALPRNKQNAIRHAGFGNLAKIALIFEEEFWNVLKPRIANLPLFWTMDNEVDHERRYADSFWMRGLESFKAQSAPAPQYVLVGFVPGQRAADMELLSDEYVIGDLLEILSQFTNLTIPQPTGMLRGNWYHNPNFRGSFSYISQEFSERGYSNADLAEPAWFEYDEQSKSFMPLLLFAGEATHDEYFSHASGAMETGFREADRIIGFRRNLT